MYLVGPETISNGTAQISAPSTYAVATSINADHRFAGRCLMKASANTGTVSHAICDRRPSANPATAAASASAFQDGAVMINACTARAAESPAASLNGRAEVIQYSGHVATRTTASHGVRIASLVGVKPDASRALECDASYSSARNSAIQPKIPSAPPSTLIRLSAWTSDKRIVWSNLAATMKSGYPGG